MPQVHVTSDLWSDGTAELILDTSQTKIPKALQNVQGKDPLCVWENPCQTDRWGPALRVSESFLTPVIFHCEFS